MILQSKFSIKQDLLAYGEKDLADKIDSLSDDELNQIGELGAKYIREGGYISKMIVLGAIEYIEGKKREPKKKKRDLSVYNTKEPETKENVFGRIWKDSNKKDRIPSSE